MLPRRIMLDWGSADASPQSRMHALRQCTFDNFLHVSIFFPLPHRLTQLVGALGDCELTLFSFAKLVNQLRKCPCVSPAQSSDTSGHGVRGCGSTTDLRPGLPSLQGLANEATGYRACPELPYPPRTGLQTACSI